MRIFNTYGPRMAIGDGRVVSNFIVQALKGEDITIYGEGNQTRSFCFVSDLVEGIFQLAMHNAITGPINLGNAVEFTMLDLAKEVLKATNSASKIVHKSLPSDDPKVRRPDLTLAQKELGYSPKVPLKAGLDLTAKYFENRLK